MTGAISFEDARAIVLREVHSLPTTEQVSLGDAAGRVLAEPIPADRDYPPFDRSARDGFAIRSADLPGNLRVVGEIRAGDVPSKALQGGEAIEIMTGAPMPEGADAVVMVEHTLREGDHVFIGRSPKPGDNFTPRGTEAKSGATVIESGRRIGYAEIALLAMVGRACVPVFRQPRVAILPTGDEIVDVNIQPTDFQIRNSNASSIAAQVQRAGGIPIVLPIARDDYESTRTLIERGFAEADMLLLSGGVSAGKYDIVEKVLADLGAKFYFDRVAIQPGQPVVFGTAKGKFFFGLPGNPISTMVTFELFARAAIDRLSGCADSPLPLLRAKLTRDFRHKPGLTRFLPAVLSEDGSALTPVTWHGSGDVPSAALANAFLVADAARESWAAGDDIRVMLR
jgi:molybdopterin molybdotransferase